MFWSKCLDTKLIVFWSKCLDRVLVKVSGGVFVSALVAYLHVKFCTINAPSRHCVFIVSWLCFHGVLVECFGPFFFPYGNPNRAKNNKNTHKVKRHQNSPKTSKREPQQNYRLEKVMDFSGSNIRIGLRFGWVEFGRECNGREVRGGGVREE